MFKKLLFFIGLVIFTNFISLSLAEIIPLKKPAQTKEEKEQKLLIDVLKPLPKPIINKIIKKEEKNQKKYCLKKRKKMEISFYPKKTPNSRIQKEKKIQQKIKIL